MRLYTSLSLWFVAWLLHLANGQNAPAPPPGGYYTTRYDHLDIEHILNQKRLVHYYAECLLDRGPCTPQGIEFKHILPEALRTNCMRCSEKQRFVTLKSIKRLKKEYPNVWAELAAIWDPTGEYVQKLEDSLNRKTNRSPEVLQSATPPNQVMLNDINSPKPSQPFPIITRVGDDSNLNINVVQNVPEVLPTAKPLIETVANTIANKPLSFSSTTVQPVVIISTTEPRPILSSTTLNSNQQGASTQNILSNLHTIKTTTKRIITTILQDRPTTTNRISYNYDFAVTVKPLHQLPMTGINMVIKGVNTIIQPISDIAGRVISAGTDIAGIVLNALGVRRTY